MDEKELALLELHARICKTLTNPRRLLLIALLSDGELSVGELAERAGLPQSTVSRHLAEMRQVGAVIARREGSQVYYRLASPHILAAYEHMQIFTREFLAQQAALVEEQES